MWMHGDVAARRFAGFSNITTAGAPSDSPALSVNGLNANKTASSVACPLHLCTFPFIATEGFRKYTSMAAV